MKWTIVILMSFISATSFAQTTQTGIVQEYNEKAKKTSLAGVELNVRSANTTISDKDGKFSLEFLTLKPGEKVNVRRIEKAGYEIFNKEAVEQWNINPSTPFVIVMCRSDKFKAIRDNYERVASENYEKQYKKEQTRLDRMKEEGAIKDEEYRKQLADLRDEYDRQLDNLDNYVDKFSRIDLSELSSVEQEIIELVQQGKFDEAISRYDDYNAKGKLLKELDKRDALYDAKEKIEQKIDTIAENIADYYKSVQNQIDVLVLAGGRDNNVKAYELYRDIADRDTANVDWLLITGNFAGDYIADYEAALKYFNRGLESAIIKYGEEHSYIANFYIDIGSVYEVLGEYEKALNIYYKALEIETSKVEVKDDRVAAIYNHIGSAYTSIGKYTKALDFHTKSYEIRKNIYGDEHPEMIASYCWLGHIYYSLKEQKKALDLFCKALEIQKLTYGVKSTDIALSLNNIGAIYESQGDYQKALDYFYKSLEIQKDILGLEHPDIAISYNNIGTVYRLQGDSQKALDYYYKALKIYEIIYNREHPDVANTYLEIGMVYSANGEYTEALKFLSKALDIYIILPEPEHSGLDNIYYQIAHTYYLDGDYQKALESYHTYIEIGEKIYDPNQPYIAIAKCNIGKCFLKQGNIDSAILYLEESLELFNKIYGDDNQYSQQIQEKLDQIKINKNRW